MRRCILLSVLLSSTLAAAGESNAKIELASRLAQLLNYGEQWQNFEAECKQTVGTAYDPAAVYQANRSSFGGITPSSAYWPRIQSIYRDYQMSLCNTLKSGAIDQFIASELLNEMTETDLRASIKFYESPEGQKFRKANAKANESGRRFLSQAVGVNSPAYTETTKALERVVNEFRKQPR